MIHESDVVLWGDLDGGLDLTCCTWMPLSGTTQLPLFKTTGVATAASQQCHAILTASYSGTIKVFLARESESESESSNSETMV